MSVAVNVGQDAQFGRLLPATATPEGALISQSGECKVVTSLMTDSLSGHFLHICHTKSSHKDLWPAGVD